MTGGKSYEFTATEGLLSDVIRKQAGSLEKAILEGVMNSVDANADSVEIDVLENAVTIQDDGDGMTEDDIELYFRQFGYKDEDVEDKEFGKFRMGRGQMFSYGRNIWHTQDNIILVSIDEDEVDCSEIDMIPTDEVVDTSGQSFTVFDADEHYPGTYVEIQLYDEIEDVEEQEQETLSLIEYIPFVFDVEISVGAFDVEPEDAEPDVETDLAYYWIEVDGYGSRTEVYNQGAFVKAESIGRAKGRIVTKEDLDINFARNDILGGCDIWEQVREEYIDATVEEVKDGLHHRIGNAERKWLIEMMNEDAEVYTKLRDVALFEDIFGETYSFVDLDGEKITFASEGDSLAENVAETTGAIVLDNYFEGLIEDSEFAGLVKQMSEFVDEEMQFQMQPRPDENLSHDELHNLGIIREVVSELEPFYEANAGSSTRERVWLNGDNELYVNSDILQMKHKELVTVGLMEVIRTLAYQEDTRDNPSDGFRYNRNLKTYTEEIGELQRKALEGELFN